MKMLRGMGLGMMALRHSRAAPRVLAGATHRFVGARWMASSDYPPHTVIGLPKLSPSMEVGTVAEWLKKEGEHVAEDEELVDIETDKTTVTYNATEDCYIAKILLQEGADTVEVGQPIAVTVTNEDDVGKFGDFTVADAGGAAAAESTPESAVETPTPVAAEVPTPVATPPPAAPATSVAAVAPPSSDYEDVAMSKIQKVTGKRLQESKSTIPHYYLSIECNLDAMAGMRKTINNNLKEGESKVSVNDFVLKACAHALRKVPAVNSQWANDTIKQMKSVDLSIAVQTDYGLITPIVTNADQKRLKDISTEVRSLAKKARDNALLPEEYVGGTFTVSNLGMYGIKDFSAVINPPQAAILAVGGAEARLVKVEDGVESQNFMTVTLSADHRVVDGAIGAAWLTAFKEYIEDPMNML